MIILLSEVNSLEELKVKGSFKDVKRFLSKWLPVKARGWKHLWDKIVQLKGWAQQDPLAAKSELFRNTSTEKLEMYRWFITASVRKYNLYISSVYEGVDMFKGVK